MSIHQKTDTLVQALSTYSSQVSADQEKVKNWLKHYPAPVARELFEIVALVDKYRPIFSSADAGRVELEILKSSHASDAENDLRLIVRREETIVSTTLAIHKRQLQVTRNMLLKAMYVPLAPSMLSQIDTELAAIDQAVSEFELKLPL